MLYIFNYQSSPHFIILWLNSLICIDSLRIQEISLLAFSSRSFSSIILFSNYFILLLWLFSCSVSSSTSSLKIFMLLCIYQILLADIDRFSWAYSLYSFICFSSWQSYYFFVQNYFTISSEALERDPLTYSRCQILAWRLKIS